MSENDLCDHFPFQTEEITLYQFRDQGISSFDNFLQIPINTSSIPVFKNEDDIDLILLRSKRNEILENLKKGQENLAKANQLYPNKSWSDQQTIKIKQLDSKIQKSYNHQTSIKNIKTNIYSNNIKQTESLIKEINNLVISNLPLVDD